MNKKVRSLMILSFVGLLVACGGKSEYITVKDSPYALLNGRKAKKVYNTLTTTGIASLNYLQTSAQANATHFANFVDGLLTHNEFGVLELNLAKNASHNPDYTSFSFEVRDDAALSWVYYNGQKYTYNGAEQRVTAQDFVTGAKHVCSYKTGSDTAYLLTDFIRGAAEYNFYTEALDIIANGGAEAKQLKTDAQKATWINKKMNNEKPNITSQASYSPLTAADIPNLASGATFGVKAEGNKVTYTLYSGAFYFPTLLTYSCYLPVNEHFLAEKGSAFGTSSPDSILYCGPYRIDSMDDTSIIYKKNDTYAQRADIRGFMQARAETVKYNIIKSEIDASYTRLQFESGNIDGFGLSMSDTEGWQTYVTGANNEGTVKDPVNANVNARLLDSVGSMYGSNINMERYNIDGTSPGVQSTSYYSGGTAASVKNSSRAFRLESVRNLIMSSFDYPTYFKRNANGDENSIFASQYAVHTYVPKNFVYDNNGNEYVDKYFTEEYAAKKGIKIGNRASGQGTTDAEGNWIPEPGSAADILATGQYNAIQVPFNDIQPLLQKALADIDAYNSSALASKYGNITLPINIEYYSMWDADKESKSYDTEEINSMNMRINQIKEAPKADLSNCPYFHVVPTDKVNTNNYNSVSGSSTGAAAFDYAPVLWGWGADYGDPLTFMNTYTKGGDWKSIFPWIGNDYVPNIKVSNGNVSEEDLLAEYTNMVKSGASETENLTARYTKFAQAEYKLINELNIYRPQVNYGQGWSLSVSKAAGYEVPTSNYGLSNERLTGMWVLKDPLPRAERNSIRAEYEAAKKAYQEAHGSYNIY